MRTLAPLAALTHLELENTVVTDRGVRLLAPLSAYLTHLHLSGEECGNPELIAVCFLTALTRLEMLKENNEDEDEDLSGGMFSVEGMRALSSLTLVSTTSSWIMLPATGL
jgi:hypothetical protein